MGLDWWCCPCRISAHLLVWWSSNGLCRGHWLLLALPRHRCWKKTLTHFVIGALGIVLAMAVTWPVSSTILKGSGSPFLPPCAVLQNSGSILLFLQYPFNGFKFSTLRMSLGLLQGLKMNALWWPLIILTACLPLKWTNGSLTVALLIIGFRFHRDWAGREDGLTGHALLQSVFLPSHAVITERMVVAPLLISLILFSQANSALKKIKSPLLRLFVTMSIAVPIGVYALEDRPVRSDTNAGMFIPSKNSSKQRKHGLEDIDVPLLKNQQTMFICTTTLPF